MAIKATVGDTGVTFNDDGNNVESFAQFVDKDPGENFQLLRSVQDPTQVVAIGKNDLSALGQSASDVGGFVPVSGSDAFTPLNVNGERSQGSGVDFNSLDYPSPNISASDTFTDDTDYRARLAAAEERARLSAQRSVDAGRISGHNEIFDQFQPQISNLTTEMYQGERANRGQLGLNRRLSTAGENYVSYQKSLIQKQINQLEQMKQRAIDKFDAGQIQAVESAMSEARAQEIQLIQLEQTAASQKINQLSTMMGLNIKQAQEQRDAAAFPFEQMQLIAETMGKVPAGQEFTVGDQTFVGTKVNEIDQFFKSGDIVDIMQNIPAGEWQQIYNPVTGNFMDVMGIATTDPNIEKNFSINDAGEGIITTYKVGADGKLEVSDQVNIGSVGKSKTLPTNVTLITGQAKSEALTSALDRLDQLRGGDNKMGTEHVLREYESYVRQFPDSGKDFLNAIRGSVNMSNPEIAQLYDEELPDAGGTITIGADGSIQLTAPKN